MIIVCVANWCQDTRRRGVREDGDLDRVVPLPAEPAT